MYHGNQVGSGTITVYRGSPYQRGHGIGTFLKGLFRSSLPLLRRGAQVVGKELLHSGVNFLNDLDSDISPKEAFQDRMKEAGKNLKRKAINSLLTGNGYKSKKQRRTAQSKLNTRKRKTSKKTRKLKKTKIKKVRKNKRKIKRKTKSTKKFRDIFN